MMTIIIAVHVDAENVLVLVVLENELLHVGFACCKVDLWELFIVSLLDSYTVGFSDGAHLSHFTPSLLCYLNVGCVHDSASIPNLAQHVFMSQRCSYQIRICDLAESYMHVDETEFPICTT